MLGHRGFAALALAAGLGACAREAAAGPDLILVSVDTLRADRLPFYGAARDTAGDPARPWSLAALAARGTIYEQCWAPAGQTVPSLGSFWTGRPPLEHGGVSNYDPVRLPTAAERLRAEGYATHARVANRALTPGIGLQRGFESYAILPGPAEARIPEELLAAAEAPIRAGERLMLWAHFMAPHQPYAPPPPNDTRYASAEGPPGTREVIESLHRNAALLDPEAVEHLRGLYDGEVRTAAGYVEELLAGLDARYRAAGRGGLLESAVVVFFSDHGEELADRHGYFPHAKSLHSGVIRVPLVIAGPGHAAGRREGAPLALAEVLPLVLDGVRPDPAAPRFAAWKARYYAARDARWTLVHNPCRDPNGPYEPPQDVPYFYPDVALYDRAADPLELVDVAARHPEEVRRLLGALRGWYLGLERAPAAARPESDQPNLEELGYIGEDPTATESCPPWPPERWSPVQ